MADNFHGDLTDILLRRTTTITTSPLDPDVDEHHDSESGVLLPNFEDDDSSGDRFLLQHLVTTGNRCCASIFSEEKRADRNLEIDEYPAPAVDPIGDRTTMKISAFSRMLQISPPQPRSPLPVMCDNGNEDRRSAECDSAMVSSTPPAGDDDDRSGTGVGGEVKFSAGGGSGGGGGGKCLSSSSFQTAAGIQICSPRNPAALKRRKGQAKKVVCIPAPAGASSRQGKGEVVPSDLWAWRKYGQKPIKGSPYPRGYYRCSSSKGCSARKQVERSRTDPNMLVITYTSEHNHPWPTQRNSLAGSTRSHLSSKITAATTNIVTNQSSFSARRTRLPIKEEQEPPQHQNNEDHIMYDDQGDHDIDMVVAPGKTNDQSTSPLCVQTNVDDIDLWRKEIYHPAHYYSSGDKGHATCGDDIGGGALDGNDQDQMDLFAELGDLLFGGQPAGFSSSDQDSQNKDQLGPFSGFF
ncbi:hypothetical protein Droror1_Dr00018316 [Drosera rotundifolia]